MARVHHSGRTSDDAVVKRFRNCRQDHNVTAPNQVFCRLDFIGGVEKAKVLR
jgi:hypothetical protein